MTITVIVACLITLAIIPAVWINREQLGWQISTYLVITVGLGALGFALWGLSDQRKYMPINYVVGMIVLALAWMAMFAGLMEFGILRLLGQFQMGAIAR